MAQAAPTQLPFLRRVCYNKIELAIRKESLYEKGPAMLSVPEYRPDLRRIHVLSGLIVALLIALALRLWLLQIVDGGELAELSKTQRTRLIRRIAARGVILDAKGRELAANRPHYVVSVLPDELKKNPQLLPRLAELLHTPAKDLQEQIDANRTTLFDPVPLMEDVDVALLTQIEEQRLDLPGVLITKDPKRFYVDKKLCTHVLGVTRPINAERLAKLKEQDYHGGDLLGVTGLEAQYETELRGRDGGQTIEVDAKGRMIHTLDEIKPTPGHNLKLTLDQDLQQATYSALNDELAKGHPCSAVAIDPNDGAVLAFVSMPSYDLNDYGKNYNALLKDPNKPLITRASQTAYPCGSPFKLITAAAGLETGKIVRSSPIYCPGFIYEGRRWNCDVRSGHGSLALTRAIAASCDVFFWRTAQRVGKDALAEWAHHFGFGTPTGIDLPPSVDAKGRIPTPLWKRKARRGGWVEGDLLNMAIGQGDVGVTPLQLCNATAALANGGDVLRPQLVRAVIDISDGKPTVTRRLQREVRRKLTMSAENRNAIVAGMEQVVREHGTAAGFHIPGVSIAGKTGTAEVFRHGKKAPNNAFFVCFAPVDHPKIAIAVAVEGGGFGAVAAAPIARQMLLQYFKTNRPAQAAESAADTKPVRHRRHRRQRRG